MKVALLNFPFDNNYGGNLQRFALMRVLENLGHEPEHLFTQLYWNIPNRFKMFFIKLRFFLFKKISYSLLCELNGKYEYDKQNESAIVFYDKYVNHTKPIMHPTQLANYQKYDAYIVGSDQVWRKSMSWKFPYETMFFNWLECETSRRIAYGVSFGTEDKELSIEDVNNIGVLYKKFYAISVREDTGLKLLQEYGWDSPHAVQVLDPTLLLEKSDYEDIVRKGDTTRSSGNLFCYILDLDDSKEKIIKSISEIKQLVPFYIGIENDEQPSIEQWLRSFIDAEYVVTDSFHGCVFSIIFNKPFKLIPNPRRGISRFKSLFTLLGVDEENQKFDWGIISQNLLIHRKKSIEFLQNSLS